MDPVQRLDLAGVADGSGETGLHRLVEEHRVEDAPGGRVEPKGHVGDTERGAHSGELGLDLADGVERGHAVTAQVVVTGGQREGESVEDEVFRAKPVPVDGEVVDAA